VAKTPLPVATNEARPASSDSSEWGVSPGDQLGRYRLVRELGRGANGQVWEAHDPTLDVHVAIKVLSKDSSARGTERLVREARAAARLRHHAIVRATDFGAHEGRPYLVLEHLVGETLENRVRRRGPLAAIEGVRQMLPLLDALHFAHEGGIVHRDVKPDNIFLAEESGRPGLPCPKLLDFGVAVDTRGSEPRLTSGGALIGTPAFMSPEQASGRRDIDRRADVWAMAVTYYECISGREAFRCSDLADLLEQVMTATPVTFAGLSGADEALFTIFRRALAKDREERFPTARSFGNALARWLVTQGVADDCNGRSLTAGWTVGEDELANAGVDVASLDTLPVPMRAPSLHDMRVSAYSIPTPAELAASPARPTPPDQWPQRMRTDGVESLSPVTGTHGTRDEEQVVPDRGTASSLSSLGTRRLFVAGASMFAAAFTLAAAFLPGLGFAQRPTPDSTVFAAPAATATQEIAPVPLEIASADLPVVDRVVVGPATSVAPASSRAGGTAKRPASSASSQATKRGLTWPTPRGKSHR
jgi:serine/threonine-protein kinase